MLRGTVALSLRLGFFKTSHGCCVVVGLVKANDTIQTVKI